MYIINIYIYIYTHNNSNNSNNNSNSNHYIFKETLCEGIVLRAFDVANVLECLLFGMISFNVETHVMWFATHFPDAHCRESAARPSSSRTRATGCMYLDIIYGLYYHFNNLRFKKSQHTCLFVCFKHVFVVVCFK